MLFRSQNILSAKLQLKIIDNVGFFLKKNGKMILVESSSNAQNNINKFRKKFHLSKIIPPFHNLFLNDNKIRTSIDANYNAYYFVGDEKLVLNVKNVDIFLNPAQGLLYDIWRESRDYNYPIPESGLTIGYPAPGGVEWTYSNPEPKKKTFFEFSQTFWQNMVNARNRQFISDGKTGGYPTLQSLWWQYILSEQNMGLPKIGRAHV